MRALHGACIAIAALGISCARQPPPVPPPPRTGLIPMHLDADEDTRGVSLYRRSPAGWQEVCREPCDKQVDASGIYSVDRDGLRRSPPFVLNESRGDSAWLAVTTHRPAGALWGTGVTAVVAAAIGASLLISCNSRGEYACSSSGGYLVSFPSDNDLAAMSFLVAGLAASAFVVMLFVPSKAGVTYANGKRPMSPPDDE